MKGWPVEWGMGGSWLLTYQRLRGARGKAREELLERLKAEFVAEVVGGELERVREWISELRSAADRACRALGARGVVYPKETKSFLEDPALHLRKKLFIYAHDLARGKLTPSEFLERAGAAVRTSLLTNSRSLYQAWVYLAIVYHLAREGFRLIYPDDIFLHLERSGRQRTGGIPPNAVLSDGVRAVSLFIEAPRPVGWEDTSDLSRAWKLYVALRPDMLAYGGRVLNIVTLDGDPPVLRPDVIIECKELDDWHLRARELKGPIAVPLSAEEWRERWIAGLYAGLADVLNVRVSDLISRFKERRGLRLKDYKIVILYRKFYNPRRMLLVTRAETPPEVKQLLEAEGIEVLDRVGFSADRLRAAAEALVEVAEAGVARADFVELTPRARELIKVALERLWGRGGSVAPPDLVERALEDYVSRLLGERSP